MDLIIIFLYLFIVKTLLNIYRFIYFYGQLELLFMFSLFGGIIYIIIKFRGLFNITRWGLLVTGFIEIFWLRILHFLCFFFCSDISCGLGQINLDIFMNITDVFRHFKITFFGLIKLLIISRRIIIFLCLKVFKPLFLFNLRI